MVSMSMLQDFICFCNCLDEKVQWHLIQVELEEAVDVVEDDDEEEDDEEED